MYVNALICMCATHNEYKHVKTDFMYMYIVYRIRQWQPTLAWKIQWTEEPGRLQSLGSRRVGHD